MKVLVVGGAGYVGCILVRELIERGYAVKVFDRLYFGKTGLSEIEEKLELIAGDMREIPSHIFENVDAVMHLGGVSNDPTAEYNPKASFEMNTLATHALARQAKEKGIRRFVLASSCSVYDLGASVSQGDFVFSEETQVQPCAAYSKSKFQAEQRVLSLVDDIFCPVILRMGTVFGFSPRMRYDLVVNTFVKDALSRGIIFLDYGGEMWRPMVDVRDVARAYISCLEANDTKVKTQIFNVVYKNFRISELAVQCQKALEEIGVRASIQSDYKHKAVRSYRVSGEKIEQQLFFQPRFSVEDSVKDMVAKIREYGYTDFEHPRYYNISWMKLLEEVRGTLSITGYIFSKDEQSQKLVPFIRQEKEAP